jgi:hypothetical protein
MSRLGSRSHEALQSRASSTQRRPFQGESTWGFLVAKTLSSIKSCLLGNFVYRLKDVPHVVENKFGTRLVLALHHSICWSVLAGYPDDSCFIPSTVKESHGNDVPAPTNLPEH